ncbi:MAG: DNA gyrase subunit B [Isosphaera sp.]|nr:DNA gyrase subunit B [Isosphaera sp.]
MSEGSALAQHSTQRSDDQANTGPAGAPESGGVNGSAGGVAGAYGAEQIQVLEGLEAVRKRPGMYIGGTGVGPLHHLVWEVVDNSIDEAMAGHATFVWVTVQADGSVSVLDDGRGIPVEPKKHENPAYDGRPAVEIAMTVLHAGGKFGQEGSAYKVSGGLHGVGVSCVNALSAWLEAEVYRGGLVHRIGFERGRTSRALEVIGPVPESLGVRTGTRVTFMPDGEIFEDTRFDFATLEHRLRELAYLNPGVTIRLSDERVGADGKPKSAVFRAERGLVEYVEHLMTGKQAVSEPVWVRRQDGASSLGIEAAMQYHDGYNEAVLGFANNIFNKDGGTHVQGFKVALTRVMNAYAKKAGILKDNDPVPTGEDLREGLIAVVSVKLANPAFNNQPKERLLNPEVEPFVSQAMGEQLGAWLEEHPAEARRLVLKGIVAAQAREAARKARDLKRKSALDGGSMPHKLRDCKTRDVERSELFIVEGDSAGGSATQGRDVETQAILPLRGKLLNVEKARIDKMLAFEEIRTLISALRCGIGAEFDAARLRYGRVVIMTDADVDGSHIRTLLLTFFFRQMPELIRRGRIFCAQPPLYQLVWGKGKQRRVQYVLNQAQMDATLSEQGLARSRLVVRARGSIAGGPESWKRAGQRPDEERAFEGDSAVRLVRLLQRLHELVTIAERRGVRFGALLASRARDPEGRGRLPTHHVWVPAGAGGSAGDDAWAWSAEGALARLARAGVRVEAGPQAPAEGATGSVAVMRELHENRELEKIFEQLTRLGLTIDDWALRRAESITGEPIPTRFAWEPLAGAGDQGHADQGHAEPEVAPAEPEGAASGRERNGQAPKDPRGAEEAENLAGVLRALHDVGRRGVEIKRFKGLGEMNSSELRDTTMDPAHRTMLRVNWDVASEADQLFSILMGEDVEQRRRFIEEHALEVKNLDV